MTPYIVFVTKTQKLATIIRQIKAKKSLKNTGTYGLDVFFTYNQSEKSQSTYYTSFPTTSILAC